MIALNLEKQRALTAEILRQRAYYDPQTGRLTWRVCHLPKNIGKDMGHLYGDYRKVDFPEGRFFVHRLVWLHFYGEWPDGYVDHVNGDPSDNRIANLRICTQRQNIANRRPLVAGKLKGITRHDDGKRWRAQIGVGGKNIILGAFDTPEEAHAAYAKRASEIHGEFARLA